MQNVKQQNKWNLSSTASVRGYKNEKSTTWRDDKVYLEIIAQNSLKLTIFNIWRTGGESFHQDDQKSEMYTNVEYQDDRTHKTLKLLLVYEKFRSKQKETKGQLKLRQLLHLKRFLPIDK